MNSKNLLLMKIFSVSLAVVILVISVAVKAEDQSELKKMRLEALKSGGVSKTITRIDSPGCVLPKTTNEAKKLLIGLQKNKNWKVISNVEGADEISNQTLAFRLFDNFGKATSTAQDGYTLVKETKENPLGSYMVALIKMPKDEKNIQLPLMSKDATSTITKISGRDKTAKLKTTFDFEGGDMTSTLLVRNKKYGLLIFEGSVDKDRTFTKSALDTVSKEIASVSKGK